MSAARTGLRGPVRRSTVTFGPLRDCDSRAAIQAALTVAAPARTGAPRTVAEQGMTAELRARGFSGGIAVPRTCAGSAS
jgi:hypothetical protein